MADREFWFPRPEPQSATYHPATSKAWVERQRTVDQFDSSVDLLAKIPESVGSPDENTRVITGNPKRLPGEIDPLATVKLGVVGPAVDVEIKMALCRQGESGPVTRIAFDPSPQQFECVCDPAPFPGQRE